MTSWNIRDKAFADVARGIRNAIGQLGAHIVPDLNLGTGPSIAGLSWPEPPASLLWPMADHSGVREAFARLLAPDATRRFLPILGPTETGKSHITKQMLANALQIPATGLRSLRLQRDHQHGSRSARLRPVSSVCLCHLPTSN